MAVYTDMDRLKFAIKNDVMSRIRRFSLNSVNEASERIEPILEETGAINTEMTATRHENGTTMRINTNVPVDNAAEFASKVDEAIKGTFRFGEWSEMEID